MHVHVCTYIGVYVMCELTFANGESDPEGTLTPWLPVEVLVSIGSDWLLVVPSLCGWEVEVGCVEVGMVGRGRSDVVVGVEALDCWSTLSEIYTNISSSLCH